MGWLITIAVGFVAGALGRFVMPGEDPGKGCLFTTLLGIGGAVVGKFVAGFLNYSDPDAGKVFDLPSLALSVGGVVVILVLYRLIFGEKKKKKRSRKKKD
ncbi:MAG: GlsB/YeaQ/YmgE family stress response membrane protein [Verrucomicrobiales bacterium]|nr:GlsB/YeaQ/YmgE family stress response membrane protein [Verrucomicrobiales bacterium]